MSGHRFQRTEYTVFEIPKKIEGTEWQWCYSAKELQEELQGHFTGKTIKAVYVVLEGYLESSHHTTDCIDLSCEGGGCIVVFDDGVLELVLHAKGQFNYRIDPPNVIKTHDTKDFTPNDCNKLGECFFNIENHDISVGIAGQVVQDIRVIGTDMWCFSLENFDSNKARQAANEKNLPAEIDLCTDRYTVRLIGDDIEYYRLKIETNEIQSETDQQEDATDGTKSNNWRFGVVGNIVKQHIDKEGIVRYGTKAFTSGTKVYIDGTTWTPVRDSVSVIARNRFGKYTIESVPVSLVENVRTQRIYKPKVLEIMDYEEVMEGWAWWKRTAADRKAAKAFVDSWNSDIRR